MLSLKKSYKLIFAWFLVAVLVSSCKATTTSVSLKLDVKELPHIESFSETEYENYQIHFPPVKYAKYCCDGEIREIDPSDPRLIRMLNFLANSDENGLSHWYQSPLPEEPINEYLSCNDPMIEVGFCHEEGTDGSEHGETPKILICGDSYLIFVDTNDPSWPLNNGVYAYRWFPYAELVVSDHRDMVSFDGWGNNYWIDIPTFAGFTE